MGIKQESNSALHVCCIILTVASVMFKMIFISLGLVQIQHFTLSAGFLEPLRQVTVDNLISRW